MKKFMLGLLGCMLSFQCFASSVNELDSKLYDKLNRKINEIYAKEDWFEQTLIQLTSD